MVTVFALFCALNAASCNIATATRVVLVKEGVAKEHCLLAISEFTRRVRIDPNIILRFSCVRTLEV